MDETNMFAKFESRRKLFASIIKKGLPILRQEGENYYVYCDPEQVPEEAKEGLATVLADITLNCKIHFARGKGETN